MRTLSRASRRGATYVVVRVRGDLDLDTQDDFHLAILRHLESSSVVVDLSAVDFVSVSSLKVLLACQRRARDRRRRLVYAAASPQALRLVHLAALEQMLELRDTVDEATGSAPAVDAIDFRAS